jgi:arylsulfatase A-like enzyme
MARPFRGKIALDIRDSVPDWEPYLTPKAPEGAPNVLIVAWDDIGYGTMDVFGGPVETTAMRRIADAGVRYANFHTTALCSPSRASLLTGRNATTNGMATIAEFSSGFPGISTQIPFENGFISEVLAERGWNTYCVGKWHLTPGNEQNLAAFKGRWPLGRGFERFYGFLSGESNSWYPDLVYDNHPIEQPATPEEGYHLSQDLADKAIGFIRDAKVVDPDKPFFMYFASQAAHAPHHAPEEWIERYRGRFDQGYEAIREEILARQKELGLLPEDQELSPINPHGEPTATGPDGQPWPGMDAVRPWASLTEDEQRLFIRMAEVFAGYVSHADHELDRVLDYLEESGQLDNTIIVVVSDNGASGEGGPNGTFNEWRFFNGILDSTEVSMGHIDELGSPASYNHYNTGWAWAFDTPFPYWKRWAGFEGGVADMCLLSWPARIDPQEQPRQQYLHAVDVVPTLYELLGIEPPEVIKGYRQSRSRGRASPRRCRIRRLPGARPSSTPCSASVPSTTRDGSRPRCTHRSPAGGASSTTCGSCTTSMRTVPSCTTSQMKSRSGSSTSSSCGSTTQDGSTVCHSTTARRSSRCWRSGPTRRPLELATSTTPTPRTSPRTPASGSTDGPTPSWRASTSTPTRRKGSCSPTVGSPAATASTSRTDG